MTTNPRNDRFKVVVNHLLAEGKERENPIPVNDLGDQKHGRAICWPNQETILSTVQIGILKDAVERVSVSVPEGSGIYEELDPLKAAKTQFPGFNARWNHNTGTIELAKERPRFAINIIGPYDPEETEPEDSQESKV